MLFLQLADKDPFGPRFALRLAATFQNLQKVSQADQQNALRVVDIWRGKGIYTDDVSLSKELYLSIAILSLAHPDRVLLAPQARVL